MRRRPPSLGAARGAPHGGSPRAGFTLMELMLAVGLLAVLVSVAVLNLAGRRASHEFDEGVRRFEIVLRMARAEAARNGRRLRLQFDPQDPTCRLLWEGEPLAAPGQFTAFNASTLSTRLPGEWVRVIRCELTGPSAYSTMLSTGAEQSTEHAPMHPVTFYPDGSSDSATFVLAAGDPDDARQAIVELNGLSGTITSRVLGLEEIDQLPQDLPRNM